MRIDPPVTQPSPVHSPLANPITYDIFYTDEEREFMVMMERYKRENNRPFPTCCEVLAVVRSLGYRQVETVMAAPTFSRTPADRRKV